GSSADLSRAGGEAGGFDRRQLDRRLDQPLRAGAARGRPALFSSLRCGAGGAAVNSEGAPGTTGRIGPAGRYIVGRRDEKAQLSGGRGKAPSEGRGPGISRPEAFAFRKDALSTELKAWVVIPSCEIEGVRGALLSVARLILIRWIVLA